MNKNPMFRAPKATNRAGRRAMARRQGMRVVPPPAPASDPNESLDMIRAAISQIAQARQFCEEKGKAPADHVVVVAAGDAPDWIGPMPGVRERGRSGFGVVPVPLEHFARVLGANAPQVVPALEDRCGHLRIVGITRSQITVLCPECRPDALVGTGN